MTAAQALYLARQELAHIDPDIADYEAHLIVEFLTGLDRLNLSRGKGERANVDESRLSEILSRRRQFEPLPYILGKTYFYHRDFSVTRDVLIPRQETEVLIEAVLDQEGFSPRRFADLGTGSGILAATLCEHRPTWKGVGIDYHRRALMVARRNCPASVMLLQSNMLDAVCARQPFDFIVSNPPYIRSDHLSELDPSVRNFEPLAALNGGPSGTDFYERIAREAPSRLVPGGRAYCEIGFDQGESVPLLFEQEGWHNVSVRPDLAGRPRVLLAQSSCKKR